MNDIDEDVEETRNIEKNTAAGFGVPEWSLRYALSLFSRVAGTILLDYEKRENERPKEKIQHE
jgi:hypothetical protein